MSDSPVTPWYEFSKETLEEFYEQLMQATKLLLKEKGLYQNVRYENPSQIPFEFVRPRRQGEFDPIGGPRPSYLELQWPNFSRECADCKEVTTFMPVQNDSWFVDVALGRLYAVGYKCGSKCGYRAAYFIVVDANKSRLQLAGRSEIYAPSISNVWPEHISDAVSDSLRAKSVGDIPGAFYHLRSALEFYLVQQTGEDFGRQTKGDELADLYNKSLDNELTDRATSVKQLYETLSGEMHKRSENSELFDKCFVDFQNHLELKAVSERFPK